MIPTDGRPALEASRPSASGNRGARDGGPEPSLATSLTLAAISGGVLVAALLAASRFRDTAVHWLDNRPYREAAHALRTFDFTAMREVKHFWGLPCATASVSAVTGLGDQASLMAVSAASAVAAIVLVHRLCGGRAAALFAVASSVWVTTSVLGGSEPLFVALVVGAFVAARGERWGTAALLAALATTVRATGAFAVAGLVFELALRRRYRTIGTVALVTAAVGGAYAGLVAAAVGDPLANLRGYSGDWTGRGGADCVPVGIPIGVPLASLVARAPALLADRWTKFTFAAAWAAVAVAGLVLFAGNPAFRRRTAERPGETAFAALTLLFFLSYEGEAALWSIPRFVVPALPWIVVAAPWPRLAPSRRTTALLVLAAAATGALAAASLLGLRGRQ